MITNKRGIGMAADFVVAFLLKIKTINVAANALF
jgi:hypothetical protein